MTFLITASFGSLEYFKKESAPEGAPVRCADGTCPIKDTCPYNCMKLYYEDKENLWFRAADIGISVKNHLIGFAAEKSRRNGTVEDVEAFTKEFIKE